MPSVDLDQRTYDKLRFSANLMNRSIGEVVRLLVDRTEEGDARSLAEPPPSGPAEGPPQASKPAMPETSSRLVQDGRWVPVHKKYKGQLIEGQFNPSTLEMRILTAPWSGRVFPSPTAAAVAVVEHVPSDRQTSNTNGRAFWKVTATGRNLRSLVGER